MTTYIRPEITLKTVYDTLKNLFPDDFPVIIRAITNIVKVKKESPLSTLAINYKGDLYINEDFWETNVVDSTSLGTFLLHELIHQVVNDTDFIFKLDIKDKELDIKKKAANIAMDARINAYISRFSGIKDAGETFRNFYTKELVEQSALHSLLAPGYKDTAPTPKMQSIYDYLYSRKKEDIYEFHDLYNEILDYLRNNKEEQEIEIVLIGDHDGDGDPKATLPQDVQDKIKDAVKEFIRAHQTEPGAKQAGRSGELAESFLNAAIGIDKALNITYFKKLAFNSIMNNVRLTMLETTNEKTKDLFVPQKISRSDIFKMMLGYIPVSWDVFVQRPVKSPRKIPIYLDVSGSMIDSLPEIIAMILNVRDDIDYVWGFSNKVAKHTMDDLRKNKINSTGGTDFDCVIDHAVENGFNNLLVITDGYAYTRFPDGTKVEGIHDVVTVVCTPSRNRDNYFTKTYSKEVEIEEITI